MKRAALAVSATLLVACTSHLERGERRYQEGDRIGALEIWRAVGEDDSEYPDITERVAVLEDEFEQLVVRYKQRGRYFEARGRLAESILDYRLALALRPDDAETLDHVQALARTLAARKAELTTDYNAAFEASDLASARQRLDELQTLDAFDPALETDARQLHDALREEISRRLAAGRAGFGAGNYAAAQRSFRATLALDPQNESARGYLSYIATILQETTDSDEPPAAFEVPGGFASDAQIRAEGFYQNAIASERTGDLYAAIRHDNRALRADSKHANARAHLGSVRARLADDVDRLIEAGRSAFREEDLQSALDLWRQALLIEPENERTQAYIARAERQLENLERLRADPVGALVPR
jgi:tetratricopeptide (TPR) repeat protein